MLQGLIPGRDEKDTGTLTKDHYERLYIFSIMWSIGAFLELDDRAKLEEFIRKHDSIRLDLPKLQSEADGTMFDYYVDEKGKFSCIISTKCSLMILTLLLCSCGLKCVFSSLICNLLSYNCVLEARSVFLIYWRFQRVALYDD